MSIYNFLPMASNTQNHDFVTWKDGFTDKEIQEIINYCETVPKQNSVIDTETYNEKIRTSKVAWIENNENISWLYYRLSFIARKLNSEYYNFDLSGFVEDFQYTTYNELDGDHYTWHIDLVGENKSSPQRKFSLVLQLSDPDEYEGGELQTFTSPFEKSVPKEKGLVVGFPSWTLHRVTPVTKGTRRTLVVWVAGPQFK